MGKIEYRTQAWAVLKTQQIPPVDGIKQVHALCEKQREIKFRIICFDGFGLLVLRSKMTNIHQVPVPFIYAYVWGK